VKLFVLDSINELMLLGTLGDLIHELLLSESETVYFGVVLIEVPHISDTSMVN
jgi:hypothetical protein